MTRGFAALRYRFRGWGADELRQQTAEPMTCRRVRLEVRRNPCLTKRGAPGGKMASYAHMRYNIAKGIGYDAIEAAKKITIPMLIIDAEKEELMDTAKNGKRVAEILQANGTPVKYHVLEGISHYGVYGKKFAEATSMEIEWFDEHLSH